MRKMWKTAAAAGLLAAAMSMTVFAGEWKSDQTGWWYQNEDGSCLKDGWNWVDGRCYYFTPDGYCLINTTTPDGYTVDGSGAWIVNGVVQTQDAAAAQNAGGTAGTDATQDTGDAAAADAAQDTGVPAGDQVALNGLTFTIPTGFVKDENASDENGTYFTNGAGVIAVMSEDIADAEQYGSLLDVFGESILDIAMSQVGTPVSKEGKQFPTGIWYCYQYDAAQIMGIPGTVYAYARINGGKVQMVMFMGSMYGMTPDDVMTGYLR